MTTREHVAAWALTLSLLTCLGVLAMAADVRAQRDEITHIRLRVRVLEDAAEMQAASVRECCAATGLAC